MHKFQYLPIYLFIIIMYLDITTVFNFLQSFIYVFIYNLYNIIFKF